MRPLGVADDEPYYVIKSCNVIESCNVYVAGLPTALMRGWQDFWTDDRDTALGFRAKAHATCVPALSAGLLRRGRGLRPHGA